ncbi:ATP-binding protein [Geodermatophilus poikilotrophus]|uniref:AAA ATPase domain-containing protein n=1 Tax=Geodermatophilus poikilotrophus TaxID=1333667 RepID=A0A1I0E2U5_9ACTN|nr:ATP-binding protein [Geodermatophilus poikilotrophus]SET39241.1 AAA ATPase domain-containing protein [Geodermatophilus poikilotrophus]
MGLTWPQWSRVDHPGLARFVTPQASHWLESPISRFDVADRPDRPRIIAEAIYALLARHHIRYALEQYHPAQALQTIRTPAEILNAPREGTCLDLAGLFCGLSLANELLPILIVIDGHALAAVSLTHGLRDWNGYRPGRELFTTGPLTDGQALRDLIDEESFLAVECTGFAHSERLAEMPGDLPEAQHRAGGLLTFDRAVQAGREQLDRADRPFQFAIDVALAHYGWRVEPYALEPLPGAWMTDIFRLLTEAPAPLASHLKVLDFERLVAERTRNFVGRDFIFRAIDERLTDAEFPSGYILIRGEPGIGKTALLSQLVRTRGYVHHFNIAPQNIRSTRTFLENICAQLIVRYQLDHPTLPPEAAEDSAFLSQLLSEAAQKSGDEPVVVVVDALDEAEDAGLSADANRLFLPPVLPPGVIVVATSREQMDYRLNVDRRHDIYLRDDDPQNLDDVGSYIRAYLQAHPDQMTTRVAAWKLDLDRFVDLLTDRSQGNFMYLVHVLDDIRTGRLSPDTIDSIQDLPRGLRAYYERHWRAMRAQDPERFERFYEPVLRILATVREPVTVSAVEEWTQLEPARIREVIREWRPYLNEQRAAENELRYRVYHASFQDFLAEEGVGLKPYHQRIAMAALAKIPGFLDS